MADALTNDLFANSVTKNDMPEYQGNGVVNFMIPWFMLSQANLALPSELPPYWSLRFGVAAYWSRDLILRSTILHESFWAGAVSKAATKAAAKSFDLTGPRSGRYQELLLDWGGDGYVPSQQRGMIDYLCSNNGEFWEIVRVSNAAGSRIIGLVHLDSLRCIRTGDPETPTLFVDLRGQYHELKYHQVISLVDMPDPAAASMGIGHCAAERAYEKIYTVMAMEQYFKEKITGTGATSLEIITGLSSPQIQDLLLTGGAEAKSKGFQQFQGHIIGGILANVDVKHITIPLRELPDGYDREKELLIAQLAYANSIGCDPQDINPALMARGALGVGAQAVVLSEKAAGFGVAARDKHMTHIINKYLLPESVTFAFQERDLREEKQQADIALVREQTRASMITTGEATAEQARQMAVDSDDMPREFIVTDQTEQGASLNDEEKPVNDATAQIEGAAPAPAQQTAPTAPTATAQPIQGDLSKPQEQKVETALEKLNLNGIQITSAMGIVHQVAAGEISRDQGVNALQILLNLTEEQANRLMGGVSSSPAQPVTTQKEIDALIALKESIDRAREDLAGEFIAFDDDFDFEIEEKKKKAGDDEEGGGGSGGGFATARSRRYFFANIARGGGGRGGAGGGTEKKKPGAGGAGGEGEKKTEPNKKRSEVVGERLNALKSDPSYLRKVEAQKEIDDLRGQFKTLNEDLWKQHAGKNYSSDYNKRVEDAVKIRETIKQKNAEIEMLNNDLRGKYVQAMKVDNPADLPASYIGIGAKRKKDFEDMRSDMQKIVSADKFPESKSVLIDGRRGARANYQRGVTKQGDKWVDSGRINIKVGGTDVYAHEFGHHLETSPGVHEKVMSFYNRRTEGEKAIHLGPGYGRSEVTKKDKFIHPYMGKVYPNASEILSMGMQHLMTDPIGLREKDKDYFDTMIDILQ